MGLTKLIEVATLLPVGWQRPRAVHQGTSLPRILVFKIHKELVVFRLGKEKPALRGDHTGESSFRVSGEALPSRDGRGREREVRGPIPG